MTIKNAILSSALLAAAAFCASQPVSAATVYWTDWTSATVGTLNGSATGTITTLGGPITVTYTGEVTSQTNINNTYPSWQPASTYADGVIISNAPTFGDIIAQNGGPNTGINKIVFSQAITNPVMSIWSLGQGGINTNYTFPVGTNFSILVGGPSNEYGGGALVYNGGANSVTGSEGNGSLQFLGTFSEITFTNTVFEGWYGFTLGVQGIAPPPTGGVPEPLTLSLFGAGLAGAVAMRRRRR